ncbi:dipeptide epimerase [Blastopirellula marina]|uniref:dipeptide epimerase n=1 Tax=Blastopirellula marina TaxID=124 RepID=UPI00130496C9|nr:dipeptide epimerase [Blastopirellula marina]
MRLEIHQIKLPLRRVFAISRSSITEQESVIVELHDQGKIGLGEAAKSSYYGQDAESIAGALERIKPELAKHDFTTPEALWDFAAPLLEDNYFALSALDQAAHDLYGKLNSTSVYQRNGLSWRNVPQSSVTISIGPLEEVLSEVESYADWPILKVKLGTPNDLEIVTALRQNTDAILRVDANCAWTVEETIRNSHALAELGVEFIEQPLPYDAPERSKRTVFEESALPIIADESCQREHHVRECDGLFHGINIKLCKCGGLTPAYRMLREASMRGLKTMVGCMIESDVAISAAAQLVPLLDFADLDGAFLLASQPADGVKLERGTFSRPEGYGCGVTWDASLV